MIADGMNRRINAARRATGLGLRGFARALDESCGAATVQRWESDAIGSTPTVYYAMRICDICGVTLDWLMYGDDPDAFTGARFPGARTQGETIGERIRYRREATRMTRSDVAGLIDALPPNIYQWETGMCKPSLYYIDRLCGALTISADELTKGTEGK